MRVELPCLPEGEGYYEPQGALHLRFFCRLPPGDGVWKVWVRRGEREVLLGTPAPENGACALSRTLTRAFLEQNGVWPPECLTVRAVGERDGWTIPDGQRLGAIAPLFRQGNWQMRVLSDGVELRAPFRPGQPFPAPPLFCLAHVAPGWVYYRLDSRGKPHFFDD